MKEISKVPVLVRDLLYHFYPYIRNAHGKTVIESGPPLGHGCCHAGHSAHLLCHGCCILVYRMDELICKRQVNDRITVLVTVEVLLVRDKVRTESVVIVEHTCDAVKTESVKAELLKPVFAV